MVGGGGSSVVDVVTDDVGESIWMAVLIITFSHYKFITKQRPYPKSFNLPDINLLHLLIY